MCEIEPFVISVDIGTGSVRACLFNDRLDNLIQEKLSVSLLTDNSGKAEQRYEEIRDATFDCINRVLGWAKNNGIKPAALCFSNAVSSLVLLDSEFKPIQPVMTYADNRAKNEANDLKKNYPTSLFHSSLCPIHATYWLPKLLWLRKQKSNARLAEYYCTIKDLIIHELTGQFITDSSNAAATGLSDSSGGNWKEEMLDIAGISSQQLPKIRPTTFIIDAKGTADIPQLEPSDSLKIVLGATDGVLSSLGAGAYKSGQVTSMIGSSGACRIAANEPFINQTHPVIWSYPLDEAVWISGGAMNSGGLVMRWFADNFLPSDRNFENNPIDQLLDLAKNVQAGSDGLLFLPYIYGERAPIWNEDARGVFFGIHANHKIGHFARAVLEGVLFALYSIYEVLTEETSAELEIRATGGFVQSRLMTQMHADIFNIPIKIPENYEGSLVGAAMLALKALGVITSYDDIVDRIKIKDIIHPVREIIPVYIDSYIKFKEVFKRLEPIYN